MGEQIPAFDLYRELEVSKDASVGTIEVAWRSLAKRNHPDTGSEPSHPDRMSRLNVAHDWLSDPSRRLEYDRSRSRESGMTAIRRAAETAAPQQAGPSRQRPTDASNVPHEPTASAPVALHQEPKSLQDRIRDLENSPAPMAYVRKQIPLWGFGADILYIVIFAGAAIGIVSEMAAGRRSMSDSIGILVVLLLLVAGGCLLLTWFGYMYRRAFRLQKERRRQDH